MGASTGRASVEHHDALVVGAGFGGLGAALEFARSGLSTALLEALVYPGGCASTFARDGYRFESGATLFSGFGPGQWFARLIERHRLPVEVEWLDPVIELVTDAQRLSIPRSRDAWLRELCAIEGAPRREIERFLRRQERVADALWPMLDEPDLLPPFGPGGLGFHLRRLGRYPALASVVGRSLASVARRDGVWDFEPLRVVLDALCQITIQCSASEAEAPFALSTLDYPFRGTAHVRGGIGVLATAMADAVASASGTGRGASSGAGSGIRYAHRAKAIERVRDGARESWRVHTTRGVFEAPRVALCLLPRDARALLEAGAVHDRRARRRLRSAGERVERGGWGACMLYLVAREPDAADASPKHLELVQDTGADFVKGNHLFVSISGRDESGDRDGRAPAGMRTLTVSTHVPMDELGALDEQDRAAYVAGIQERMDRGIERLAPEWHRGIEHRLPASPRTFARFTGRHRGFVGGVPRRRGFGHYLRMGPLDVAPGLVLVGDSAFPGQSTLATALGGAKAARRLDARVH